MPDQEDYGDLDEGLVERIREAALAEPGRPAGPRPDEQRSQRAERRFAAERAARRLWAAVVSLMQRGQRR